MSKKKTSIKKPRSEKPVVTTMDQRGHAQRVLVALRDVIQSRGSVDLNEINRMIEACGSGPEAAIAADRALERGVDTWQVLAFFESSVHASIARIPSEMRCTAVLAHALQVLGFVDAIRSGQLTVHGDIEKTYVGAQVAEVRKLGWTFGVEAAAVVTAAWKLKQAETDAHLDLTQIVCCAAFEMGESVYRRALAKCNDQGHTVAEAREFVQALAELRPARSRGGRRAA